MYRIISTNIIDHSKRKGLQQRVKGLVTVIVTFILNEEEHVIQFLPDTNNNYNLKLSSQYPGSKTFIESCKKFNINPDKLASEIKEKSKIQDLWEGYVFNT